MAKKTTRKAVYVPSEIWNCLDADAKKNYDTVTTVLKNVLISHYGAEGIKNNNKGGNTTKTATDVDGLLDEDENDDEF